MGILLKYTLKSRQWPPCCSHGQTGNFLIDLLDTTVWLFPQKPLTIVTLYKCRLTCCFKVTCWLPWDCPQMVFQVVNKKPVTGNQQVQLLFHLSAENFLYIETNVSGHPRGCVNVSKPINTLFSNNPCPKNSRSTSSSRAEREFALRTRGRLLKKQQQHQQQQVYYS